VVEGDVVSDKK